MNRHENTPKPLQEVVQQFFSEQSPTDWEHDVWHLLAMAVKSDEFASLKPNSRSNMVFSCRMLIQFFGALQKAA